MSIAGFCRALPAAAIALIAVAAAFAWAQPAADARRGGDAEQVAPAHRGGVPHPLVLKVRDRSRDGTPMFTNEYPHGYAPLEFGAYLRLTGEGEGETIGIVSAFRHPAIREDLNRFSEVWGLPLTCDAPSADPAYCFEFTDIVEPGTPVDGGWALETALDVEWAHGIAPRAKIVLVQATDAELPTMIRAITTAIDAGATVVSNSWGADEDRAQQRYARVCRTPRAVCVFASGNSGHGIAYPAAMPAGIAVGGTSLPLDFTGEITGEETAWTGSSGGVSRYEARPRYQRGIVPAGGRGVPDVSYHADPKRGYGVFSSVPYQGQDGWFVVGGTSAGAPQWAAIVTVANELRVADGKARLRGSGYTAHEALYGLAGTSGLFDVDTGTNGACGPMCAAGAGYDLVTGLGSPRRGIDVALAEY